MHKPKNYKRREKAAALIRNPILSFKNKPIAKDCVDSDY